MFDPHMFNFISPSAAFIADKRRFCSGHAQGDMVNIHNKKCQALGCTTTGVRQGGPTGVHVRDAQVERDEEREEQDMCRPLVHEATVIRLQWGGTEVLCAAQARRYDQHQESAQPAMFLSSFHEVPVVRLSGGYKPSLLSTPGGGHDRRSDPAGQEKTPSQERGTERETGSVARGRFRRKLRQHRRGGRGRG